MRKRPTPDDMLAAVEWLSEYEADGSDDEVGQSIVRVIQWLSDQAESADIRQISRETGIPTSAIRARLRQSANTKEPQ